MANLLRERCDDEVPVQSAVPVVVMHGVDVLSCAVAGYRRRCVCTDETAHCVATKVEYAPPRWLDPHRDQAERYFSLTFQ